MTFRRDMVALHDRIQTRLRAQPSRRRTCAWCHVDLGPAPADLQPPTGETHGICEPCAEKMLAEYVASAK